MIRKATVEDLPLLMEIEKVCFKSARYSKEQIEWILTGENEAIYIYFEDARPVGSVMLSMQGDPGRVISIGVHPDWREKGVARELMNTAEKWFSESGAREVDLEVSVENSEALNLYSSMGYEVVRVLRGYYYGKVDAYQMRKELRG
ncbi:MAG: GNAT family N-acetyltransferase [Thermoplasmata archaeon]|nr:GNAT family N-acetyltransferase [Thermoplasmata archaeon]